MECPICYKVIENSCIGSCTHHFCYVCLLKWCSVGGYKCPICKVKIREIRFDKEFDLINNPDKNLPIINLTKTIYIDFSCIAPGITLKNNSGPGVIIEKLKKNEKCYISGLREKDVILSVNNVPFNNHSDCIDIINYCFINNINTKFDLLLIKK